VKLTYFYYSTCFCKKQKTALRRSCCVRLLLLWSASFLFRFGRWSVWDIHWTAKKFTRKRTNSCLLFQLSWFLCLCLRNVL